LDAGVDFPQHVTPHQAAAALLLMLQQLPDSLMPPDVAAVLVHCVPPVPSAMLSDAMSVAEWATLRHLLAFWRRALAPDVAGRNGLSVFSLAGVLAQHVFGDTTAAGGCCQVLHMSLALCSIVWHACMHACIVQWRICGSSAS
jgi:hypothetical protein